MKTSQEEILRIIGDPDSRFTLVPHGTMTYANFLGRVGIMKRKPETWRDMFFSNAHGLAGD